MTVKNGWEIGNGKSMKDDWDERAKINAKRYIACPPNKLEETPDKYWSSVADACYFDMIKRMPSRGTVLDLGCGIGRILEKLLEEYPDLKFYGVDVSEVMIKKARKHLKGHKVKLHANDGYKLPFIKNNSFDFVFSFQVFQHISKDVQMSYLHEIFRVLKQSKYAMVYLRWNKKVEYDMDTWSGYCFKADKLDRVIKNIGFSNHWILDAPVSKVTGEYPYRRWLLLQK